MERRHKIKHKDREKDKNREREKEKDGEGSRRRSESCFPPARPGARVHVHVDANANANVNVDSGAVSVSQGMFVSRAVDCAGLDVRQVAIELEHGADGFMGVLAFDPVACTADFDPIPDLEAMLAPGFMEPHHAARQAGTMLAEHDPVDMFPGLSPNNFDGAPYQYHMSFHSPQCGFENVFPADLHTESPGR